jgi:hypothetical protein
MALGLDRVWFLTAPKDIQEVEMILPLKAMVNMVRLT